MVFEDDLYKLKSKMEEDHSLSFEIYNALCDMRWINRNDPNEIFSCSWRYAGEIVTKILGYGNYKHYYNSGDEGRVTKKVEKLFNELGWEKYPYIGEYMKL